MSGLLKASQGSHWAQSVPQPCSLLASNVSILLWAFESSVVIMNYSVQSCHSKNFVCFSGESPLDWHHLRLGLNSTIERPLLFSAHFKNRESRTLQFSIRRSYLKTNYCEDFESYRISAHGDWKVWRNLRIERERSIAFPRSFDFQVNI